nr:acetyl-CoA carboxylase biotin carboxyl carrier protein [Afifella sp. IM 167]
MLHGALGLLLPWGGRARSARDEAKPSLTASVCEIFHNTRRLISFYVIGIVSSSASAVKRYLEAAYVEGTGTNVPLTFKDVAEILKLIDASQCEELILELEGAKLVVRRGARGGIETSPAAPAAPAAAAPTGDAGRTAPSAAAGGSAAQAAPAGQSGEPGMSPGMSDVRAPMVGTFYRRPSPDAPPFVEEGKAVKKGDPLCLIEVMKLFTTVEAPADGTVEAIVAEEGALVEFDQLLFRLRA